MDVLIDENGITITENSQIIISWSNGEIEDINNCVAYSIAKAIKLVYTNPELLKKTIHLF